MKTLAAIAIALLIAAVADPISHGLDNEPAAAPFVAPIPAPLITSADVKQMVTCGAYVVMIDKSYESHDGASYYTADLAQGWLRTAMFYAAAVEGNYITALNIRVLDAKMHSENLMGKVGVPGVIDAFHRECGELIGTTDEYVKFWETHGNA